MYKCGGPTLHTYVRTGHPLVHQSEIMNRVIIPFSFGCTFEQWYFKKIMQNLKMHKSTYSNFFCETFILLIILFFYNFN